MNILFLEENVDPQRLQFAHGFQQRDRIPGKAADAFRQHQIDLSGPAVGQKTLEFRPFGFRAGQSSVCVYACITPAGMFLDFFAIIADLRGERMQHGFLLHGNAGIGRHIHQLRRFWYSRGDFMNDSVH